jgi:hypothetical protein
MWLQLADETGKLVPNQGNCCIPLAAIALSQMNVNLTPKSKLVKG